MLHVTSGEYASFALENAPAVPPMTSQKCEECVEAK